MDLTKLQGLLNKTQVQEKPRYQASKDENFPLHRTPMGGKFLVYVPMAGYTQVNAAGEYEFDPLRTLIHTTKNGNKFSRERCITGLHEESMGYDGVCPLCEAANVEFEFAAAKVKQQQDVGVYEGEELKALRRQHFSTMKVESSEEYITFPGVFIPSTKESVYEPAVSETNKMHGEFITMKTERFNALVTRAFEAHPDAVPGQIAGIFWVFNYGQVDASKSEKDQKRDAGKDFTLHIIVSPSVLTKLQPLVEQAEALGSTFTKLKAVEVLTDLEFKTKDEVTRIADGLSDATRQSLAVLNQASALGVAQKQIPQQQVGTSVQSALDNFNG